MSTPRIAVLGDRASVLGFKVLGFDAVVAEGPEAARAALARLVQQGYAVIYVVEATAAGMLDAIAEYADRSLPAIVLIPGSRGSLGLGLAKMKRAVEKAVGADILFGKEG
ncbi:MAG: V-type ATP synthase subunit F [Bacillota bacterium]|nr:V-type ATP synthase subunit F [Bacillota bacterium]